MKLFFETAHQADCFLLMIPLGLALAFLLDADVFAGRVRLLLDCLLILAAGAAVLVSIVFWRESGLRLYHLLGLFIGAVLYVHGIGRLIRAAASKWLNHSHRQEKRLPM